jgi:ABC-type histidine transport system ATPase subunit
MVPKFVKPDFSKKSVELRFENNEVCVYGTKEGLQRLLRLINDLIDNPKKGHIHLEDYELLTEKSLIGAVAVFDKEGNSY